jgi:transposase
MLKLSDRQWEQIEAFLHEHPRVYVGEATACRRFMEGVLWILRSGPSGGCCPPTMGIGKRFDRWSARGVWADVHASLAADLDLENVLPDSTVVRAHPCAAGAKKGGLVIKA